MKDKNIAILFPIILLQDYTFFNLILKKSLFLNINSINLRHLFQED